MQSNEDSLIREMVETIVREADPDTVILFGSRARGNARADSDVDLLIVERETFGPQRSRRQETARLYLALRKLAVPKNCCSTAVTSSSGSRTRRTTSSAAPNAKEGSCMSAPDHAFIT